MLKRKSGVYAIQTVLERLLNKDVCTLKIGHSSNLKKRFNTYNTGTCDKEHYVQNHLKFILHSKIQAFNGSGILESIAHHHFQKYRVRDNKEFFIFPLPFDIEDYFKELNHAYTLCGISDVQIFRSLTDVPYVFYKSEENEEEKNKFEPRECQKPFIKSAIEHYKK